MATYSGGFDNSGYTLYLDVSESNVSIANNTSVVNWTLRIVSTKALVYGSWDGYGTPYSVSINGSQVASGSKTYDFRNYQSLTVASGSKTITHNSDGSKSISCSASFGNSSTPIGDASASGTFTLSKIPRYATSNQSFKDKTETSITMDWSSDSTIDYIWYSKDNGSNWTGLDVTDGKSGSYTINGLSANTTYNIKTRVRRKDSQLTTDSSNLAVTTYDYPYCTDAPNFTIGDLLTIKFYNPLGRQIGWQVLGNDGSLIAGNGTTGTSYTGINGEGSINNLYASIPKSKSGTYTVKVTYGSSIKTKTGGTYSIKGTEKPTVGSISYVDSNETTVAITGDNQHIVQNKSNLKVTYTSATGNKSATISKYTFTLNGVTKESTSAGGTIDFGVVNSSNNVTLTMVVTDSRGLTSSTTKTITILAHSNPNAIVTLNRKNNYEDETYLTVDGSIASVNSKNKMTIKYRYKLTGGNYGEFTTIEDNVKQTLSLNKENAYIFNIIITDSFGSEYNQEHTLNKGVFPLFIDIEKNSVGANCLPINENSFEINGTVYTGDIKCKNLLYTPYTEDNKLTLTATQNDHAMKTNHYCYLEEGKRYTFSCKTDGVFGGSNGTDTVEVFLLKDNAYDLYVGINTNPKSFTVTSSGYYFLRYDVNKSGMTHSFWDFQIEEGNVATDCVEAKNFSNKQVYSLGEIQIGTWIDGKPVYRKVVSIPVSSFGTGTASSGASVSVAHNIKNIGVVLRNDLIWERPTTVRQKRILPSNYYGDAGWDGQMFADETNIQCELGTSILNAFRVASYIFAILEYTKTTD